MALLFLKQNVRFSLTHSVLHPFLKVFEVEIDDRREIERQQLGDLQASAVVEKISRMEISTIVIRSQAVKVAPGLLHYQRVRL
jgi:hypothetical protein